MSSARPGEATQRDEGAAASLRAERTAVEDQLNDLTEEFESVVATVGENTDDEHDAEGATLGFERTRVDSLRRHALERLVEIDAALAKVASGDFGRCESCGQPIAAERLCALPSARTCVTCPPAPGGVRRS